MDIIGKEVEAETMVLRDLQVYIERLEQYLFKCLEGVHFDSFAAQLEIILKTAQLRQKHVLVV
jgi:hypothetical protein